MEFKVSENGKLARYFCRTKGNSIEGGTHEVQLSIIAKYLVYHQNKLFMSLVLNEEQKMLKTSAKEFLDNKFPLSNFRKYRDNDYKSLDFDLWTEMAEMGWTLIIPEKYNGLNFGYVGLGQVIEEMGKVNRMSNNVNRFNINISYFFVKNEFLKSKLFSGIMNGSVLICLAHEEGNQHHQKIYKHL